MSKELIERLRLMSADTIGSEAANALESLEAAYASAVEAGKALAKQALKAEQERDALAAELKALREQEPVAYMSPGMSQFFIPDMEGSEVTHAPCLAHWMAVWTKLYARPVPARELSMEEVCRLYVKYVGPDYSIQPGHYNLARAIERYLKGEGE